MAEQEKNLIGGEIYSTPYELISNTCDFFDFQFDMNSDGTVKECRFQGEVIDLNIGAGLFLIRKEYIKQKDKVKKLKKNITDRKEKYQSDLQAWTHQKHCYKQAIASITDQSRHWKYTVRAFEQLARANENTHKEIMKDKKSKFSLGTE